MGTGFPQARLQKRLQDIDYQIGEWIEAYKYELAGANWRRSGPIEDRIAVLQEAQRQLDQLYHLLNGLPRLS